MRGQNELIWLRTGKVNDYDQRKMKCERDGRNTSWKC